MSSNKHKDPFEIIKCNICGKTMIKRYNYAYVIKKYKNAPKYFCSYSCYRKGGGDSGKCKSVDFTY